jgi:hypothetical protein
MSQRTLLVSGIVGIAASLVLGAFAITNSSSGLSTMSVFAPSSGTSISIDKAQQSVQSFLDRSGNSDLKIDELMEFDQNFYAVIKEKSSGVGAFELLVYKSNGTVGFEPGPNMMWNTKYSMMGGSRMMTGGGMMGGGGPFRIGTARASMSVTADQAAQIAQRWLDKRFDGDLAGTADGFYGYYTFHFEKNSQIAGMLSVNGYSGDVWFHTWHGNFVQVRDFGA